MQPANFDETLERILLRDTRYHRDSYFFVREALDYTQRMVEKGNKDEVRHVSGQEPLSGIRAFGLEQFGPMTRTVLNEWGIRACEDFGEIVFNLVESGLLAKTDTDTRNDFKGGYEFFTAFDRPYVPSSKGLMPEPEPKSTQV